MSCELGREPGDGSRSVITWTKAINTVAERMEDDSLIHLFTNKRIKRRTKLLNSYLRKNQYHSLTYNDYIKAKTAVLRTLSEDEETEDEGRIDNFTEHVVSSVDSQKNTLRAFLKEMMLESSASSDEFENEPQKSRSLRRRQLVNCSMEESPSTPAPKRPRGRPRKFPLPLREVSTNVKRKASRCTRSTSILQKLWENCAEAPKSKNIKKCVALDSPDERETSKNSVNVVTDLMDDKNHNLLPSPISLEIDPPQTKIQNESSLSKLDHSAAVHMEDSLQKLETATERNESEDEFLTPATSDCDELSEKNNDNDRYRERASSMELDELVHDENLMSNDDMFEEEKVVTENIYSLPEPMTELDSEITDENGFNVGDDKKTSEKDLSIVIEDSTIEEDKNTVNDIQENGESLTQSCDPNHHEIVDRFEEIKDNTEGVDNKIFTEISSFELDEDLLYPEEEPNMTVDNGSLGSEKVNSIDEPIDATEESIPSPNPQILDDSPTITAAVRTESMTTSEDVDDKEEEVLKSNEENVPEINLLNLNENTKPNDNPKSIGPVDSGIDDDSGDVLVQEYMRFKKEEEEETEEKEEDEIITPKKKRLNLKITCTEVVKSKYMIIRDNEQGQLKPTEPFTEQPAASKNPPNDGLNSPVEQKIGQKVKKEGGRGGNLVKSNHRRECPEISAGEEDDILSCGSANEEERNVGSFKKQLANHNSDEEVAEGQNSNHETMNLSEKRTLSAPSEAESLKWVLSSLVARRKHEEHYQEEDRRSCERETALTEHEVLSEDEGIYGRIPRPMNIPEFIEGTDLMPFELPQSFTLADITENDDIYLLEIPKSIVEQNLKDHRFILKKKKVIIGDNKYMIQEKECEPLSCILHTGNGKNRYKTGTIVPLQHIVVRQQIKSAPSQTPKLELEARKSIPFPVNIKSRNPLVFPEEAARRRESSAFLSETEDQDESNGCSNSEGNQEQANDRARQKSEGSWKKKRSKKRKRLSDDQCSPRLLQSDFDMETHTKLSTNISSSRLDLDHSTQNEEILNESKEEFEIPRIKKNFKKRRRLLDDRESSAVPQSDSEVHACSVELNSEPQKRKRYYSETSVESEGLLVGSVVKTEDEKSDVGEFLRKSFYEQMMD